MATQALERDPVAELGIKLISADNHINEPRDLFIVRLPAHLKDKAPQDNAVRVFGFELD